MSPVSFSSDYDDRQLVIADSGPRQKSFHVAPQIGILEAPRVPGWMKIGPWRGPGRILEPLELLESSWRALGDVLDSSRRPPEPKRSALERLLASPRRFPRQVSAILGGQKAPEKEAKRVQNRVQEASRAQHTISSKTIVLSIQFLEF